MVKTDERARFDRAMRKDGWTQLGHVTSQAWTAWQLCAKERDAEIAALKRLCEAHQADAELPPAVPAVSDDVIDAVSKALRRAWQLGQTYWQQADSESYVQNAKSEVTHAKFNTLVEETQASLAAAPTAPAVEVGQVAWSGAQVQRMYRNTPELHNDCASFAAFSRIVRVIEAAKRTSPPKMTDEQVAAIAEGEWAYPPAQVQEFARAIESARDGQWRAALGGKV